MKHFHVDWISQVIVTFIELIQKNHKRKNLDVDWLYSSFIQLSFIRLLYNPTSIQ